MRNWLQGKFAKKTSTDINPWKTEHSIFSFLSSHINKNGRLSEGAYNLPDETDNNDEIKFAPGLADAMFGEEDSDDSKQRVAELSQLLKSIANKGDKTNENQFYALITEHEGVIGIIDDFLNTIVDQSLPIEPYLFNFAKDLATKTNQRNAVKFGIAILGLCQNQSVLQAIKILGLHDEFTVYATIAIANLSDHPLNDLWELAQKVDGWGKIQLVDRLTEFELEKPIKNWLLLEGYKNNIMYEYLAYTCAINGELHEVLDQEQIEHHFFKSASNLIDALIVELSPAQDITTYVYASEVIENFIKHAQHHAFDIVDYGILHKIKDFLTVLHNDIGEQKTNGWTQDHISNCLIEIVKTINSRDWTEATYKGLKSADHYTYWHAKQAAKVLGIDLWETVWNRLKDDPLNNMSWFDVVQYAKPEHTDKIMDFALAHIPLEELATGPDLAIGLGTNFNKYGSLEHIIVFLKDHPEKGEEFILAGLQCPVTRVRYVTLEALQQWTQQRWSSRIKNAVTHLQTVEPDSDIKDQIKHLLYGEELQ